MAAEEQHLQRHFTAVCVTWGLRAQQVAHNGSAAKQAGAYAVARSGRAGTEQGQRARMVSGAVKKDNKKIGFEKWQRAQEALPQAVPGASNLASPEQCCLLMQLKLEATGAFAQYGMDIVSA